MSQRTAEAVDRAEKLRRLSAELSLARGERTSAHRAGAPRRSPATTDRGADVLFRALQGQQALQNEMRSRRPLTKPWIGLSSLTRSLSAELAPPVLYEDGLAAALEWLASQTAKNHNVQDHGQDRCFSGTAGRRCDASSSFRRCASCYYNAVKHAGRSAIHVAMANDGRSKVRIVVSDHGAGFDTAQLDSQRAGTGGFGLFSIRERITSIGGEFRDPEHPRPRHPGNTSRPSQPRLCPTRQTDVDVLRVTHGAEPRDILAMRWKTPRGPLVIKTRGGRRQFPVTVTCRPLGAVGVEGARAAWLAILFSGATSE